MIIDRIENIRHYVSINPLLEVVANYLEDHDLTTMDYQNIKIHNDDVKMNICLGVAKSPSEARLEAHRVYTDVQLPLEVTETIGYKALADCTPTDAYYDESDDIVFFEGDAQSYIKVPPGMFVIFFPQDAHAPCIGTIDGKKAIFKIKNEL